MFEKGLQLLIFSLVLLFLSSSLILTGFAILGLVIGFYFLLYNEENKIIKRGNVFYIHTSNHNYLMFHDRFSKELSDDSNISYLGMTNNNPHAYFSFFLSDSYFMFVQKDSSDLTNREFKDSLSLFINDFKFWVVDSNSLTVNYSFGSGKVFFSEIYALIYLLDVVNTRMDRNRFDKDLMIKLTSVRDSIMSNTDVVALLESRRY